MDEKRKEQIKADLKAKAVKETELTSKEEEEINEIFQLANQPVSMKDEDFECGAGELDIRGLNAKNVRQMQFRAHMLEVSYLKSICDNQADIIRILLVMLKKQGVEDVAKEIGELVTDLREKFNKGA